MQLEELAGYLEKMGNPTRLAIVRLLIKAGPEGMSVGALQGHLGIPASTLSHHLLFLATSSLIRQEREGRVVRCTVNLELLNALVQALMAECCSGVDVAGTPASGSCRSPQA
jgi:ArsR family transcriptional regulator, arsenate/arsenite/antimonite-responsive transcriptional repressor